MAFVLNLPRLTMSASSGPSRSFVMHKQMHNRPTTNATFALVKRSASTKSSTEIPTIGSVMNRKSFGDAWRGLSPNQRIGFGLFVLVAGAGEYFLLKRYVLDPVKVKKAEAARAAQKEGEMIALPGDAV